MGMNEGKSPSLSKDELRGDPPEESRRKRDNKKPKPLRPFRIRPNAVVALRYQPPSAEAHQQYSEVWLDPTPNRDVSYNLIGKQIRCIFPKHYNGQDMPNGQRVLEGEIVQVMKHDDDHDDGECIRVQLLVHKSALTSYPFLEKQIDDDIFVRSSDTSSGTRPIGKNKRFEEQIRGKEKVIINLKLASTSNSINRTQKHLPKWVIRKWVSVKMQKHQTKQIEEYDRCVYPYVTNSKDQTEFINRDLENNFRWVASKTHYNVETDHRHHEYYQIGQVMKVAVSEERSNKSTLAMVTVKRLILPELTPQGRSTNFGEQELFDTHTEASIKVPIERLIVIGHKLHRFHTVDVEKDEQIESKIDTSDFFVRYQYSFEHHSLRPITTIPNQYEVVNSKSKNDGKVMSRSKDAEAALIRSSLLKHPNCASKKRKREEDDSLSENAIEESTKEDVKLTGYKSFLNLTNVIFDCAHMINFDLPLDFLVTEEVCSEDKNCKSLPKRRKKKINKSTKRRSLLHTEKEQEASSPDTLSIADDKEKESFHFQPTSARCIPYSCIIKKRFRNRNNSAAHARSLISNRSGGRKVDRLIGEDSSSTKQNSSRAARASQRRRNKEIELLGLKKMTNMSGREDAIRFGKSTIHGWGVFSDSFISGGDLIVEYRGILIGNKGAK